MKTLANFRNIKETVKHGYQVVCTSTKPKKKYHGEKLEPKEQVLKHIIGDHENHHIVMNTILKDKQGRTKQQRYKEKEARYRLNNNRYENLFIRLKKQGNGEPILSNQQLHSVEEFLKSVKGRKRQKLTANKKLLIGLYKALVLNNCLIKKSEKKPLSYEKFHNEKMNSFWKKRDKWFEELLTKNPISDSDRIERLAVIEQGKEELREAEKKQKAGTNKKNAMKSLVHADYTKAYEDIIIQKWMEIQMNSIKNATKSMAKDISEAYIKKEKSVIEQQAVENRDKILASSRKEKPKKKTREIPFSPSVDYVITVVKDDRYTEHSLHGTILEIKSTKLYTEATDMAQSMHDKWFDSPFCKKPKSTGWTYITERYSIYKDPITGILVNKPGVQKLQILITTSEMKKNGLKVA